MTKKKILKEGDKCPDSKCSGKLIVALICDDDTCGGTVHPADGYRIQIPVYVVIYLVEGILEDVAVHRQPYKAKEDYKKRIIEAYGEFVDKQHGKEKILITEAVVIE